MERYSEYKDSGVKWLGEIPSHWEVLPIKYISKVNSGATPKTSIQGYWDGNITWVTPADFKTETKFVLKGNRNITTLGVQSCSTVILPKGSLVFSKRAPIGQVSISKLPLCTNQGCFGIIPDKSMNNSFLYYSLAIHTKAFYTLGSGTTFRELSFSAFSSYKISVPPRAEQDAIVRYLDAATSKIDKAITMQQKMIDLLNERKQIIIQNAVTKGLDENVEMKDSGVEWSPQIPKKWNVRRLRFLCDFQTGDKDTINRVDNGKYPFFVRSPQIERINSYTFDGEAILMAGDGVGAGKVFHYYKGKFDYHQRVYNLHNFRAVDGKYLFYYLKQNFKYIIERAEAKSTVDSVRIIMLKDFMVCFPSIKEQQAIVAYLDKEMLNFDSAISNCQRQITLLQERKQIIINEVVTGKVKVS